MQGLDHLPEPGQKWLCGCEFEKHSTAYEADTCLLKEFRTAPTEAAKPHPVDVALSALSEFGQELLSGTRYSRFAELQRLATIAQQVQYLKPASRLDDLPGDQFDAMNPANVGFVGFGHHPMHAVAPGVRGIPRWNDAADLQTQIIMLAQEFLKDQKEKNNKPSIETRLTEVTELASLMELRLKLLVADQQIPAELNARIDSLLQQIGAPPKVQETITNERPQPQSGSLVLANDVRRHPAHGAGGQNGGGMGEPVPQ